MAAPDARFERLALRRSILVTAVLGALGIAWGLATGSQMILLDGIYAFIGIIVSGLLLRASSMAEQGPTRRYPYGREAATPLVIGIQGFVLLITLVYALVEAIYTILGGGSDVTAGWAIVYATITAVTSTAFWWWLRSRTGASDLIAAESTGWRVAALRVGMVIGFSILWIITDSRWHRAAPYIDPTMVIITCAAFLPAPVRMVRGTIIELLEGAPKPAVQAPVHTAIAAVFAEYEIAEPDVRMTKVGPKLYVEIDATVRPDVTIAQTQQVRDALRGRLEPLPYEVWLNFELTPEGPEPARE